MRDIDKVNLKDLIPKLCNLCKDDKTDLVQLEKFFDELQARGIRKSDPRVSLIVKEVEKLPFQDIDKNNFSE